tara:strand:- start:21 stop:191 length:171 start_codon:yes stop_codon:yes gene_type:complete
MIILKRKKRKKKRITQKPKERNWIAQKAFTRTGAGSHTDKKKEASRRACRGRTNEN